MPINKRQLLSALKSDLKSAEPMKKANDAKISVWRDEYEGNPYGNEVEGRSAIVSRDIKKQSEWQLPSILDPFLSGDKIIRCRPVTSGDVPASRQNELLLNTQFCRMFDRFNFMNKAIKVLDQEGTLVVQTGWEYEYEEVDVDEEVPVYDEEGNIIGSTIETVKQTITIKNHPTARVCRNEDVFFDPTCQDDLDKAQFFIYRYETDLSTLRKDGRYKNLNQIGGGSTDPDYSSPDETKFEFKDEPRKKIVVYEYWGNYDLNEDGITEPIVCAWVNDVVIRLEDNPYPDGKPPFLLVPFNSVPFKPYGEANAEMIGSNQKIKTAILRGIIDNMAKSNNGQVAVRKGALDTLNKNRFLQGRNFEFNGSPDDFWQGSYNQVPGSVFDMLALQNNEIESLTGVKSFSGGISGSSLGPSATGARGALDAAATRRMHLVRNIAENLIKPLMRKWIAYNAVFLDAESVIRITEEEYVTIQRDDLDGRIDIDIDVATAEDNAAKIQELSFLLQTIGPTEDPAIRRELMATIMDLMRMPAEARRIREYQPEPDPVQQQLQELEMLRLQKEIALLDYEARKLEATTQQAAATAVLTTARSATEEARAENIRADTDNKELEFIRKDEDVDNRNKLMLAEHKRLAALDNAVMQSKLGDKNIGVLR